MLGGIPWLYQVQDLNLHNNMLFLEHTNNIITISNSIVYTVFITVLIITVGHLMH